MQSQIHSVWYFTINKGSSTYQNNKFCRKMCKHKNRRQSNYKTSKMVWLNGWVFVYEISGYGFESRCSHLNFRFRACFEQGAPRHSGNYRVWISSEMRTWHDKNIQRNLFYMKVVNLGWKETADYSM